MKVENDFHRNGQSLLQEQIKVMTEKLSTNEARYQSTIQDIRTYVLSPKLNIQGCMQLIWIMQ